MFKVHMPIDGSDDHIPILQHPERIFVPACLVPANLALRSRRWHVSHQDGLHASSSQQLQLDAQPLHLLVSRLCLSRTSIHRRVRVEEVHCVEAEDGKSVGDGLDEEIASSFKNVALLLGDEFAPDIEIFPGPTVRPRIEDVVGNHVVVAEVGYDRNGEGLRGVFAIIFLAENFLVFLHHPFVQLHDLVFVPRELFVIVMTG